MPPPLTAMPRGSGEWALIAGLALLLALFATAVARVLLPGAEGVAVRVTPVGVDGAELLANGHAVRLPSRRDGTTVLDLAVQLPARATPEDRWVLWVGRTPLEAIALDAGDGRLQVQHFFAPGDDEGLLASGYVFPLPADAEGARDMRLELHGTIGSVIRPRLIHEVDAMRVEQRGAAVAAAIYSALFTLSLLSLALFAAAGDRSFLRFFALTTVGVLMMASANGHLYQLAGFDLLGRLGIDAVRAFELVFVALLLQLFVRHAGFTNRRPTLATLSGRVALLLYALAAVSLLGIDLLAPVLRVLTKAAWTALAVATVAILVDAARRRVPMTIPLLVIGLPLALVQIVLIAAFPGRWVDAVWVRLGGQAALAACGTLLAVTLVGRIREYRQQRDRDQLAREDSERRMKREAARADLNTQLQDRLRQLAPGDLEFSAFRLLLDHLLPLVPVEHAAVVVHGYNGRDALVVSPQSAQPVVEAATRRRMLVLKRLAASGIPQQQPVTVPSERSVVAMEAILPLGVRAPAWGLLLLQRKGGDGFTTDEMALAGELARLTLLHIEQALSAINLRRSAELDAMTGTFNRRTIDQWLGRCFGEAVRDGSPLSVLFVDLDHFKSINDRFGHATGDECLRKVAMALRKELGEGDLLGRYGGEEFIVVLPGRAAAAARAVGEQIRAAVERVEVDSDGQPVRMTVSVGVAARLDRESKPAETVDRADKALYAAKRSGRNCVQVAPAIFA